MKRDSVSFNGKKQRLLLMLLLGVMMIFCAACGAEESPAAKTLTGENGVNNIPNGGLSVLHEGTIYYVGEGENGGELLCSMDENGENQAVLYTPESNLNQISYLNTDGSGIYFMETVLDEYYLGVSDQRIQKLSLADHSVDTLGHASCVTNCLTLYGDTLYYTEARDFTEEGPYWMTGDGGDNRLMALSVTGGTAKELNNEITENFIIYEDRIYSGLDIFAGEISSFDLNGKDKEVLYSSEEDGVNFLMLLGDRIYFKEYIFEAPPKYYSMNLNGKDVKEFTMEEASDCNAIGSDVYFAYYNQDTYTSDGDLTVESTPGTSSDTVSSSDLEVNKTEVHSDVSTNADLKIEGSESFRVIPGSTDIYHYQLNAKGKLDFVSFDEGDPGLVTLGSFSGKWRFYSALEPRNGRTLMFTALTEDAAE